LDQRRGADRPSHGQQPEQGAKLILSDDIGPDDYLRLLAVKPAYVVLRDNGGGSLSAGKSIADYVLANGIPVVIDGYCASACAIIAAAAAKADTLQMKEGVSKIAFHSSYLPEEYLSFATELMKEAANNGVKDWFKEQEVNESFLSYLEDTHQNQFMVFRYTTDLESIWSREFNRRDFYYGNAKNITWGTR